MKTASGAFLLALVAFLSSIQDGKSALVLFEGEVEEQTLGGRPSLAGVKACKQQVEHVCPSTTFREDLLFEGVANKLTCLSEGRDRLGKACFYGEMNDIVSDLVYGGPDQCRQEIRKKCGKQIDDLKKAIQHTEIIGTVKGAVDVVECLVQNSEDLWNKCKPNGKTVAPPQLQEVTVNRETLRCQFRLETMCPMEASKGMLGFEGAAGRLECLARNVASRNAAEVADQCLTGEMSLLLETIVSGGPDKCRQEIRKKCGKQIDDTKKAIEDLKVVDAAKRIVDLTQCLSSNAEDFWNKCKPEGPKDVVVDSQSTSFVNCKVRAEAMCPITSNMVVGLGFRMGCLAEHASQLGNECVQQEMKVELGSMDALQGSKCHDAIRSKCGKQIDQLKKAIQDTSVLGTLKSAVDVTQCIAQNAEELFNKCKPFEEASTGCQTKMDMYCPNSLGLGQQLGCLAERAGELGSECMQKQAEAVMIKIDSLEGSKCQDELRNKCGKQIDQLKKAIRDNALFSILVGTVEVAQCLSQNAQDIADKCKPFTEALEGDCQTVCRASNDILGTGRQVACLADQATKIGEVCLRNEMQLAVSNLETFGDSKCKDEIRNKCGKQIDQFKKAIRDNALFSLVIGAFEVAQCLSQNAQEIAEKCRPFPATVCQTLCPASNDILGTGRQVACLADHSSEIGADCLRGQMALAADKMETFGESKCKDEIRNKCGKQIDQFKKAIRDNALFSLVIGAFEVSQCFVQNAQDIANKCRPFEEVSVLDCDGLTDKFCPVPNNKILGLGYHVGCLAEHVNEYIGAECVQRQMMLAMANLDALDGSKCHDEMRNKCGKQIDQLKKAIRETAIISIIKGAVDVAQCTAQNAEDLWNKCKPFQELPEEVQIEIVEDEQEPEMETLAGAPTSKKATKKPTKKSTSSPSKKATSKPSNAKPTSKPSNAKPTSKPTSKAISEAIFLGNEDDEDTPKMSVSHVEIDMDKCVRSARKFCSAQVLAVNESPFDKTLMDALNYCIEVNAAAIEAECVVKESNSWGLDNDRNPPHHRYPHDDDLPRPYPHGDDHPPHIFGACGNRHHHRHRHAATAAATSVFVFLVVLLVGRRVYLRRKQALSEDNAECGRRRHHHHHHRRCCWWRRHHHGRPHHEESPMASASAYQRIKSDDSVAVPSVVVGNIV